MKTYKEARTHSVGKQTLHSLMRWASNKRTDKICHQGQPKHVKAVDKALKGDQQSMEDDALLSRAVSPRMVNLLSLLLTL